MPRPLDLRLPQARAREARRWWPLALSVSVGAHVALLLFGGIEAWFPRLPQHPPSVPATMVDTVPLVYFQPPRAEPRPPARREAPRRLARRRGPEPFVPAKPE